jgi:eukaryotic-like serine/threonine-protein kinase
MVQETDHRVLAGRYEIKGEIGRGGMGVVWKARDGRLQRDVAIKEVEVPASLSGHDRQSVQERACREAQAAARLNHPSAVTVFDVLEEDGRACIVMELVDAPSLAELVERHGPLTPGEAARVGLQILGALDTAHRVGIVHRDVKPANVMVTDSGDAKLADFGIASVKDDTRITATGLVLGSPSFMSPEQGKGETSSAKTDLWSLGATLFYAVEGRAPFDRGHAIATLGAVIEDDPAPLTRAGDLEPVIWALLEKNPDRRPDAAETRRLLQAVAAGDPVVLYRAETTDSPATTTGPAPALDTETRRRPLLALGALALVLALAAGGAYLLLGTPDDSQGAGERQTQAQAGGADKRGTGAGKDAQEEPAVEDGPVDDTGEVAAGTAPEGWTEYTDPTTGYAVAYPEGWTVETASATANSTDFSDPATGGYVRVDWKQPPGPSAVGAWEDYEPAFAADHAGYERIGEIEPTTYQGFEAATWEFTFEEGGTTIHAVDLGFIVGDDYGFALYMSAPEESWDDLQDEFETFQATFRPPQ